MNKVSFFKKKLATNSQLVFLFFLVFIFSLSLVKIAEAKNIGIGTTAADKVGIGTDSPAAKLQINPTTSMEGLRIITSDHSPFIIRNAANTADLFRVYEDGRIVTSGSVIGSNSYWNLSGSNLYASSTSWNVGIGTVSPFSQMQISGTSQTTSALLDSGNTGGTLTLSATNSAIGSGGTLLFSTINDNSTYVPQAAIKSLFVNGTSNGVGDLAFSTRNAVADTALVERMRITYLGNVGIGVISPAAKLNVSGDIYADGDDTNDRAFRIRESGGNNYGAYFKYGASDTLTVGTRHSGVDYTVFQVARSSMTATFPGSISVAAASTFSQPLIVGSPTATNHAATKSYVDSASGGGVGAGTSGQTIRHNGTSWIANSILYNNGTNVGVNTTAPNSTLDVNGVLSVGGKTVLTLPSNNPEVGPWNPIWSAIGASKPLFFDEEFASGYNSVSVYNNSGGSSVVINRLTGQTGVPNSTGNILRITYNGGTVSPGFGGFILGWNPVANRTYVQRFRAKLPVGRYLVLTENSQGSNNTSYWLTNTAGTGKWEDYIRISHAGNTGTFAGGGHVYVTGGSGAFTWDLASANVYEVNTPIISSPNTWVGAQTFSGGAYFPGSGVWNTSGNVGIGSASPAYALDVPAAARFSSPLIVGTPTSANHAVTKSYVDSSIGAYMPLNGYVNVNFDIASNVNNSSYSNAAIELREYNHAGTLSGAASEAPRLSFHWGGRVASQIALETDGTIMIRNNPGTDYENFAAKNIFASGYLSSSEGFGTGGSITSYGNISSNGHISSAAGISTGSGNLEATLASDEGPSLILRNPNKSATGNYWSIYNMTGGYGNSLQFWSYGSSSSGGRLILSDTGNMTLNGDLNAYNLTLSGKTAIRGSIDTWLRINDTSAFTSGTYFGSGIMRTDGIFQVGPNGDKLVVNGSSVGIGVTSPSDKLHVKGALRIEEPTDTTTRDYSLVVDTGGGFSIIDSVGPTTKMKIGWDGKVGIGTTAPTGILTLSQSSQSLFDHYAAGNDYYMGPAMRHSRSRGTISSPTAVQTNDRISTIMGYGHTGASYQTAAKIEMIADGNFTTSNSPGAITLYTTPAGSTTLSERMRITNVGNVGIGTTAPSEKLEVIGSVKATAFVYNSSDRTLKKNIATINNPIEKIMKLRGVTFDWKKDNSPSIGLIAQEVEKVFPELVTGEAGNKAVAYNNLVAPLIEAVKAQQKEIDELNTKINKLELKLKKASVTR